MLREVCGECCKGAASPTPRGMSGGANNPGGMNPSPTGGTLTGFDVKLRRGQDPSLRCKPLKGIQWQGCGPGMPGPYGLL